MDIAPTQAAGSQQTAATSAATDAKKGSSALSSDFETFLKMLTVQMQNQDPLNPMNSTEFAVQLATFSGVEQQVQTNELLTAMGAQLGIMGMSQMASWVGMEARTSGPLWVDGSVVELKPQPAASADRMALVVRKESGAEAVRVEMTASDEPISWAPVGPKGDPLPPGAYTFELVSLSRGDVIGTSPIETYSKIVEVSAASGATELILKGGVKISPDEVTALRTPNGD